MDTTSKLSLRDTASFNSLSRRWITGSDPDGLDKAAELLALCITEKERFSALFWWNEGCRDYADGEKHREELVQALKDREQELYPRD